MTIRSIFEMIVPIVESKALSIFLVLAFATYIAYVCHKQTSQQRETSILLHEKLLASYVEQVRIAKECQRGITP